MSSLSITKSFLSWAKKLAQTIDIFWCSIYALGIVILAIYFGIFPAIITIAAITWAGESS